jgi:predicted transcriptional regulator of viral defense system
MKYQTLNRIKSLTFGYAQIADILGISPGSARVSVNRYVRQGFVLRVKRNLYVLSERWRSASQEEKFIVSNLTQVPSYISLLTALEYYGITTQVQRDFIESVGIRRSTEFTVGGSVLRYTKIDKKLYFGFSRKNGIFIAEPEKAFLDAFYLMSLSRYSLDLSAINADKLNRKRLAVISASFPDRTRRLLKENGYIAKA